jgi:hypothetical protein
MNIATLQTQLPSIEHLIQARVPLRHRGHVWIGRCPFHDDRGRPNLVVFPTTQTWKCFVCGAQGDRIDWIVRHDATPLADLLHAPSLVRKPQVTRRPHPPRAPVRASLLVRDQAYRQWFPHTTLAPADAAHLRARGWTPATIAASHCFTIQPGPLPPGVGHPGIPGWAWDAAHQTWIVRGPAGLAIPIYTPYHLCVGLQVRTTHGPKYQWLSSARDPHGAPAEAQPHFVPGHGPDLWITEGPLKAWLCHQVTQAPCLGIPGISLWRRILPWIPPLRPRRIILAFDQDADPHTAQAVAQITQQLADTLTQAGWPCVVAHWNSDDKGIDDALIHAAPLWLETRPPAEPTCSR